MDFISVKSLKLWKSVYLVIVSVPLGEILKSA